MKPDTERTNPANIMTIAAIRAVELDGYLDTKYLYIKILPMQRTRPRKRAADGSGTHLWLVLMKAHRALERVATRSIESSEVGLSDFAIMEMLLHKGPQPVSEIGRRVDLTSGAITTAVDRLESRGLVTREAHPRDRRARVGRLTPRGRGEGAKIIARDMTVVDA